MKGIKGFFVLCGSLLVGNLITAITNLPVPGSIFGMLILLILLMTKRIKLETVEPTAQFLMSIMIILFVPGAVNMMNVYEKFDGVIIKVLIVAIVSTLLTISVTALVADKITDWKKKGDEK